MNHYTYEEYLIFLERILGFSKTTAIEFLFYFSSHLLYFSLEQAVLAKGDFRMVVSSILNLLLAY